MTDWTWHRRAQDCIAHGALTNSKRPECLVKGVYPTHLKRGSGCFLWDVSGKKYVDFICGLGTNLLGYGDDEIAAVISNQARLGACLSLGSEMEVLAAEKVKELFPFIEQVRFLKTGTDACNAAVRIARTKSGRIKVLSSGYHGWGDEFVALSPPALGVNLGSNVYPLVEVSAIDSETAAVIVEPVMTDLSDARIEYLKAVRAKCDEVGALLIFDEVITGFRFPNYSFTNTYGILPDLICLGKAIANGMPLAVVGGKKSVMSCGEYFVSSTYAGDTLSLAAAIKTMTLLQTKYKIDYLWDKGAEFIKRFNEICAGVVKIEGYNTRGVLKGGNDLLKALFMQEAVKGGLLFGPSWFFNFKHIPEIDAVLNVVKDVITKIKSGNVKLEGEMPSSPFAQKLREAK